MSVTAYDEAVAALRANRIEIAEQRVREAISQDPNNPYAYYLGGRLALMTGRQGEAEARFKEALRLFPVTKKQAIAASWVGLGRARVEHSPPEEAMSCFDQALKIEPGYPPAHMSRAALLCDIADYKHAESEARHVLNSVDDARTRLVLARALLHLSRLEEARPILEELAHHPELHIHARHQLASCMAAQGQAREAEKEFRDLLGAQPHYPAYLEFARTKTFQEDSDGDLKRMHGVLDSLPAPADDTLQPDLCFALAKAYDDLEDAKQAWSFLARANRLRAAADPFDFDAFERDVDTLLTVGRQLADRPRDDTPRQNAAPLAIAFLPRSGSSLLEQMLAGHPAVGAGGEYSPFLPPLYEIPGQAQGGEALIAALDRARRSIAQTLAGVEPGILRVTDKSPHVFLYAGLLDAAAPDARFINLTRHPMDVALGQYRQAFARDLAWASDLELIARYHALYERVMSTWRECLGDRMLEVNYEALVYQPEEELTRILNFCGLDYDPACLEFQENNRAVWTASNLQIREQLNARGIGRWLRYEPQMQGLLDMMRDSVTRYEAHLRDRGIPY